MQELFGHSAVHRSMEEERSGGEDVDAWLCSLEPRAELVARMALHLQFHVRRGEKSYFARIAALIKELDLTAEDLSIARADAQKVAASLGGIDPGSLRKRIEEAAADSTRRQSLDRQRG